MKLLRNKEYQRLIDIECKYRELIGQTITLCTGSRSRRSALLTMNKEELVRIIFDINNYAIQLQKKKVGDEK